MAGTAAPGLLSPAATTFAVAGPDDEADLRRLLRDNPIPGAVAVSLEREPNFFAAADLDGDESQTVLCRNEERRVMGMGARAVRATLHDGSAERTGYLSQLRLDRSVRGGFHLVTRGFRLLRQLHEDDGRTRIYLTSIMESNTPARRLLESGVRGMPLYRPIDRFETSIIARAPSTRRPCVALRRGIPGEESALSAFLVSANAKYRFAHVWDPPHLASLAPLGLTMDRFIIAEQGGTLVACAAVWDQRRFKQSVVRGYSPMLNRFRSAVNALSGVLSQPRLPAIGCEFPLQFLSHSACQPGHEQTFAAIVEAASAACGREECNLVVGFASRHPLARVVDAFRRRLVRSVLCAVSWPDGDECAAGLVGSAIHTEVSLL